jgi:broad specificity phosphatase PhoE
MTDKRTSIDGAQRRRLYLFRHGAVDYVDQDGKVVPDPDVVSLNVKGQSQADAMGQMFAEVTVDRVICSGLARTRETARRVIGKRDLAIEIDAGLEEIRPATRDGTGNLNLIEDIAFSHWRAVDDGSRFLGGELYADFYVRIAATFESILADPGWQNLAVFAHGGTNAAILGWVTGLELSAFGVIDQATCCLNVIDFDIDSSDRRLLRKSVRGMNITVDDPAKGQRHSGDMESLARNLMRFAS